MIAMLVPIWLVDFPPLLDYLGHFGRMYVLANLDDSQVLQAMYRTEWAFLPNLAMDILVPALAEIMPLTDAARVFLSLAAALWLVGAMLLHRALFGRMSLWPLAVAFFFFNEALHYGFANFMFAAGLMFVCLAAWVETETWRPWRRLAVMGSLSLVLFFCHLIAFGLFGICVVMMEAARSRRRDFTPPYTKLVRRAVPALGQFLIPVLIFFLLSPTSGQGFDFEFGRLFERFRAARAATWISMGLIDYAVLIFLGLTFLYATLSRGLRWNGPIAAAVGALFLLGVVAPAALMGGWGLHVRIPPVVGVLLFAGTCLSVNANRTVMRSLFAIGLVLLTVRTVAITDYWREVDAGYDEFRAASVVIPEGASILTMMTKRPPYHRWIFGANRTTFPFHHLSELATIERTAFSPSLWARVGQQPIRALGDYADISIRRGSLAPGPRTLKRLADGASNQGPLSGEYEHLIRWQHGFDFVVAVQLAVRTNPFPAFLEPVHQGSYFTIYRVVSKQSGLKPQSGPGQPTPPVKAGRVRERAE